MINKYEAIMICF